MRARLRLGLRRSEAGFGLIELLIAMTMLAVALLALVAALSSGLVSFQRAGMQGTAATLADKQMEKYRALKYTDIRLDTTAMTAAASDAVYTGDTAWDPDAVDRVTGTCTGVPAECNPRQTVTGPDNRSYRVDTYIVYEAPAGGRQLKRITVVVRNGNNLSAAPLARLQSRFDELTGR